ncbi:MAG: M20/M25/M40 family metallo-hydrolase [Promethearchaeota archaeon]
MTKKSHSTTTTTFYKWRQELFPIDGDIMKETAKYLSELIKIDTTNPPGNETKAAEYCKKILEREGFTDIELIESEPGRGNLICRWKGKDPNSKKLLLLAHLDVVPADDTNWIKDPFCGEIDSEYIWGRGAVDCKNMVIAEMMAAILLKREGFQPKGDIILAFTADEEAGGEKGVGFLVKNYFDKINADYAINEGGGLLIPLGKNPNNYIVQTGEKGVFWTKIRIKGKGGHGSMPIKNSDNAIYKTSIIIKKILNYKYPIIFSDPVNETIEAISLPKIAKILLKSKHLIRPLINFAQKITKIPLSSIIFPLIMDIINPTVIKAGEKVNVIPQYSEILLDCRLLPGHDRNTIELYLRKALGKKLFREIEVIPIDPTQPATVNSTHNPFWDLVENIMNEMHKGAKLVPMMSAGSTDSKFLRERGIYSLGFCPFLRDPNMPYSEMIEMAHGKNERVWLPNLSFSLEFFYRLIKKL